METGAIACASLTAWTGRNGRREVGSKTRAARVEVVVGTCGPLEGGASAVAGERYCGLDP